MCLWSSKSSESKKNNQTICERGKLKFFNLITTEEAGTIKKYRGLLKRDEIALLLGLYYLYAFLLMCF